MSRRRLPAAGDMCRPLVRVCVIDVSDETSHHIQNDNVVLWYGPAQDPVRDKRWLILFKDKLYYVGDRYEFEVCEEFEEAKDAVAEESTSS